MNDSGAHEFLSESHTRYEHIEYVWTLEGKKRKQNISCSDQRCDEWRAIYKSELVLICICIVMNKSQIL